MCALLALAPNANRRLTVAYASLVLIGLALSVAASAAGQTTGAAPTASEARVHLARAERAAPAGDWEFALSEYALSNNLEPSVAAAEGIAKAQDALRHNVDAFQAYTSLLRDYAKKLSAASRQNAESRLAALAKLTVTLTIQVSESDARVAVDGTDVGVSPIATPIRAAPGLHRVHVTKAGFRDAEVLPNAQAGADVVVAVTLIAEVHTGHVSVREVTGKSILVVVDGVERGTTPWEGDLEAGPHEVHGRDQMWLAAGRTFTLSSGERLAIDLVAAPVVASVDVVTSDRKGVIYIDGHVVGEGAFHGEVPAGGHILRVVRDGREPFEKQIILTQGQSYVENVSLSPATVAPPPIATRAMRGAYGGLLAHATLEPSGENGDLSSPCSAGGLSSCSASSPLGGGLLGYAGYMADAAGIDALLGVQADSATATTTVGQTPTSFVVPRVGAVLALRARVVWQTPTVRLTFAGGVGGAFRGVALAQNDGLYQLITGGSQSTTYLAPAVTLEGAALLRIAESTALSVGLLFWAENAGNDVMLKAGPLMSPVRVLSSVQAFLMPSVGLEFGP